jgi:ABC-type spermidine/putrescine transport system permease subunit II
MTLASRDIASGLLFATALGALAASVALWCTHLATLSTRQTNVPRFLSVLALATPMTIWVICASTALTASGAGRAWLMATMLVGMLLHVLAPATEILVAGLRNVPAAHVEAARATGLGVVATWRWILLPQIRVTILLSFGAAWVWSLNEVTLPVLLAPPGFSTLMLRIFQTVHYGPPELLAAYTLLHIVVIALAGGCVAMLARSSRAPA